MYLIVSIYYNDIDVQTTIIDTDYDMEDFCIQELKRYKKYDEKDTLEILINKTIKYGKKYVNNKYGRGVIAIIEGDNLLDY